MSHTFHHGSQSRYRQFKFPDFKGTMSFVTPYGKAFAKHYFHKAHRRYGRKLTKWELYEALQELPKFETEFDEHYDTLSMFYMKTWLEYEKELSEEKESSWSEYDDYDSWDDDAYERDYTSDWRF